MKVLKIMCKNLFCSFASVLAITGALSLSHSAFAIGEELDNSKTVCKRPPEVVEAISDVYQRCADLKGCTPCRIPYALASVDEFKLLSSMVKSAPEDQKRFDILDLGAGSFSWGQKLETLINDSQDFPSDVNISVVSVRAEKSNDSSRIKSAKVTRQDIGAFKVEDLSSELQNHQLPSFYDVIVSCFELDKLADPAGTFLQAYNALRPGGVMLFNGFSILDEGETYEGLGYGQNRLPHFLGDLGIPYLLESGDSDSRDQWAVRKVHNEPLAMPWEYKGVWKVDRRLHSPYNLAPYYTCYGVPSQYKRAKFSGYFLWNDWGVCGDVDLYDFFFNRNAFASTAAMQKGNVPPYLGTFTFSYSEDSNK